MLSELYATAHPCLRPSHGSSGSGSIFSGASSNGSCNSGGGSGINSRWNHCFAPDAAGAQVLAEAAAAPVSSAAASIAPVALPFTRAGAVAVAAVVAATAIEDAAAAGESVWRTDTRTGGMI